MIRLELRSFGISALRAALRQRNEPGNLLLSSAIVSLNLRIVEIDVGGAKRHMAAANSSACGRRARLFFVFSSSFAASHRGS
jgi:hypothetical protein